MLPLTRVGTIVMHPQPAIPSHSYATGSSGLPLPLAYIFCKPADDFRTVPDVGIPVLYCSQRQHLEQFSHRQTPQS